MGKRGPPKTPTATLSARGSWLAKTRQAEPETAGSPMPPDSLTDSALDVWNRLLPQLEAMGVAGEADTNSLAIYVTLFARWRECEDWIAENGSFSADGREYVQVGRSSKLADQLINLGQQYGMTASARASLAVDTTNQKKEPDGIAGKINPRLVR